MSRSADLAHRAFRMLAAPLRQSRAGIGAQEWLRPETIDGLSLDLAGRAPRITVHVDTRWPLHLVPRWLDTPHGRIELRARHSSRPVLQCAIIEVDIPSGNSFTFGTAGFLANDAFSPGGYFLVTAGHVLSENALAEFDDPVRIQAAGAGIVIERARLAETSVPLAGVPPGSIDAKFPLDAGLIRLPAADWRLLADGLPQIIPKSTAAPPSSGDRLSVLLPGGQIQGSARSPDAVMNVDVEQVQPDGSRSSVRVRFNTLCSSRLDQATQGGDSGAAVRDAHDRLIGIHCAFLSTDDDSANAFYTPITPILDYFGIVALTEASRATGLVAKPRPPLSAALPRPPITPPPAPATQPRPPTNDEAIDTLARTLWAEARGEGHKGMEAVACVVLNRVAAPRWWGRTITEVCRKPFQFSCWNEGTSSRAALLRVTSADPSFAEAQAIAGRAATGQLPDFTKGALHYHAIEVLPKWAAGRVPCFSLGRHVFYNDIERRTA